MNTFVANAYTMKTKDVQITNTHQLRDFVDRWISKGSNLQQVGSEIYADLSQSDRVKSLSTTVTQDPTLGFECVRFQDTLEEVDNPQAPADTLVLNANGFVCVHPNRERTLVVVSYGERHIEDNYDPAFSEQRRRESGSFLSSFEFL